MSAFREQIVRTLAETWPNAIVAVDEDPVPMPVATMAPADLPDGFLVYVDRASYDAGPTAENDGWISVALGDDGMHSSVAGALETEGAKLAARLWEAES